MKGCAAPLKATPFRVSITDHTSAIRLPAQPGYGPWELSADRANAIRKQLEADGAPTSHFFMVAGKADTQPLFPDDPSVAAIRGVTITLMRGAADADGRQAVVLCSIPSARVGRAISVSQSAFKCHIAARSAGMHKSLTEIVKHKSSVAEPMHPAMLLPQAE